MSAIRKAPDAELASAAGQIPEERQTPAASLTWRIHGWSDQKERLLSPTFQIPGSRCTWRLLVFPKGNGKKAKGHVSAYIYPCSCAGEPRKETVSYRIEVVHPGNKDASAGAEGMFKFIYSGGVAPTEGHVPGGGFQKFVNALHLRNGKFVRKGNTLLVRVKGTFLSGEPAF
ncbi:hypothetical protein WJX72_009868 [[Myrmecia] bisecta]|uniref:MATH domain-containing protein n=1 Tax=[Myrmecia] bisecta TaxID=41462 RepID=A0AAW1Q833_9CHLO